LSRESFRLVRANFGNGFFFFPFFPLRPAVLVAFTWLDCEKPPDSPSGFISPLGKPIRVVVVGADNLLLSDVVVG